MVLNLRSWPDSHGESTDDPILPFPAGLRLPSGSSRDGWTEGRGEMISMRKLATSRRSGDANHRSRTGAPLEETTIQVRIDRQKSSRAGSSPRRTRTNQHQHHVVIETETIVMAEDSGELTDGDHDKLSQLSIDSSNDDLGKYAFDSDPSAGKQEELRLSVAFAPPHTYGYGYQAGDTERESETRTYGR